MLREHVKLMAEFDQLVRWSVDVAETARSAVRTCGNDPSRLPPSVVNDLIRFRSEVTRIVDKIRPLFRTEAPEMLDEFFDLVKEFGAIVDFLAASQSVPDD